MFDQQLLPRRRIAIVGGGISGLSAAYYLSSDHAVTLFEAAPRLGGHARTVIAGKNGNQPVDMGFIVFNYATYPNLTWLFDALDVPVVKSDMSFAASIDDGRVEYGLNALRSLFAQRRNLLRPGFYRMIADIVRFGKRAESLAASDDMTIGELISELGLSREFRDHYLLPMCGAIWSTPVRDVDCFPARSLIRFFRNHGLLASGGQHQWWTVKGGSVEYLRRLEAALLDRSCVVHTASPVSGLRRGPFGVVLDVNGRESVFDEVVLACHSDQALAILGDAATSDEHEALSSIRYQSNTAVLHADPSVMPRRRACWSSWNYHAQQGAIGVTYWMNRLQRIPEEDPLFVTLNPSRPIDGGKIYDTVEFSHPQFDKAALRAQSRILGLQGQNQTWFCGAYNRYGFHEDGVASARRVARLIDEATVKRGTDIAVHG